MLGRFLVDLFKHGIGGTLNPEMRSGQTVEQIPGLQSTNVIALDEINCLVKGRHGWFLANRYDEYLGRALTVYGEYAELEHEFLCSLLRTGDHVIEVGANIGTHTVGLAKAVGPGGGVVAIEPQPTIFRVLCANLALNGLANVTPVAFGCGAQKATMSIPAVDYHVCAAHNSGGVSLEPPGEGVLVTVMPIDEMFEASLSIELLKVDVEGMEKEVLEGASRLIEQQRPLLYVENDRVEKSQVLVEWIMAAGYRLWWHTPTLFNANNFFGVSENIYKNFISLNMLCVPKETALPVVNQLEELTESGYHVFRGY
jgi:FkbM family methyltransferase